MTRQKKRIAGIQQERCIFWLTFPKSGNGTSQAYFTSPGPFWIHYGHPFHPELTGVHKIHSQISPVREFNAAITFFSVATTNFLDPGENSKEANLSFPTYCCLLKKSTVKCKGPKPSLHKMLWKNTTAQIHKVITIVLILGWKRNIC